MWSYISTVKLHIRKVRMIVVERGGYSRISWLVIRTLFFHGLHGIREALRRNSPSYDTPQTEASANVTLTHPLILYKTEFDKRQRELQTLPMPSPSAPSFSIITAVYSKTDPDLFLETVKAIAEQSYRNFEWIVLRHGEIPERLVSILEDLSKKKDIVIHSLEENLGILGGMRFCLENAQQSYVVPLDSDDLIIPEALAVIARHIESASDKRPDLCYTDEAWLNGTNISPIFRSNFDPMLNFSASTVWHLMAFKREAALELKVYSDENTEYCHDWDTLTRFYTGRKYISHIPEVAYLWRQHSGSTSNNGGAYTRSHTSQKAVLSSAIDRLGQTGRLGVEEFPIWRDTKEFRYRWFGNWPKDCYLILLGDAPSDPERFECFLQSAEIPSERVRRVNIWSGIINANQLREVVETLPKDAWCWIMNSRLCPEGRWLLEETSSWFTLLNDMDFLCGNVINEENKVAEGGLMFGFADLLGSPEAGHPSNWSGPYAMHLRPHFVDAPNPYFFAARISALLSVLQSISGEVFEEELAARIGLHALKVDKRIGWSPLLRARVCPGFFFPSATGAKIKKRLSNEEMKLMEHSLWYSAELARGVLQGWYSRYDFPKHQQSELKGIITPVSQLPDIESSLSFQVGSDFSATISVREIKSISGRPELIIILPGVDPTCFSGGPNTAFLLAAEAAKAGYGIHALSVERVAGTTRQLQKHLQYGLQLPQKIANRFHTSTFSMASIKRNDKIMATRYDTALIAHSLTRQLDSEKFIYLIQDFEPMFHPWNDDHALSIASYEGDFLPIVNESLLGDFFMNFQVGRFSDEIFRSNVLRFEPAIDRTVFYPIIKKKKKRILLFYARPKTGIRNLSNLGFHALSILARGGVIHPDGWEVFTMGESSLPDVDIGGGMKTHNLPWMNFTDYAECVRTADIGLSLMLSPHTSYLPLEFASCGVPVVTNCYANKTADALSAISPCIIGVKANPKAIALGLKKAIDYAERKHFKENEGLLHMPISWNESFASVTPRLVEFMASENLGVGAAYDK